MNLGRLHVVLGSGKVKLNIGLHTTDLVVRLALQNIDRVRTSPILNVNRVTLVKDRVMRQLLLKTVLEKENIFSSENTWERIIQKRLSQSTSLLLTWP